jgi:hypothetical protein
VVGWKAFFSTIGQKSTNRSRVQAEAIWPRCLVSMRRQTHTKGRWMRETERVDGCRWVSSSRQRYQALAVVCWMQSREGEGRP